MHLAFTLYFFLTAASVEAISVVPRATVGDIWGGINITQNVLQVAGAISSPTCNATSPCVNLTTIEVRTFQQLHLCVSFPSSTRMTPEQSLTGVSSSAFLDSGMLESIRRSWVLVLQRRSYTCVYPRTYLIS
jgi:hypothetical protein